MIHAKPTSRTERGATITYGYKLKTDKVKSKFEVISGGWKEFNRSKDTRLFYVTEGYAIADINGKESVLEPGVLLEVLPDTALRISGQIKYFAVRV